MIYAAFYLLIQWGSGYGPSMVVIPYSNYDQCAGVAQTINDSHDLRGHATCLPGEKKP